MFTNDVRLKKKTWPCWENWEITIYCDQQLILMPQEQISLQPIGIAEDVMARVSWVVMRLLLN